MNWFKQPTAVSKGWLALLAAVAMVAVLFVTTPTANAQTSSATVNGTVQDTSGAVVPGASVTLKNQASGDERTEVSNGDGFFNFAAVPPGTYSVIVTRQGFKNWQAKDINVNASETRAVANIKLQVGAKSETVVVEASETQITPSDSGEKSFTIGQNIMQNVAIIGQNAAEFIKIMPGFAMQAGTLNQSSYAAADDRTGSGPVGNFSANGQRLAALDITSDGAHIVDPGCNCGQAENTNVDMTSEVTVQTSNFGADSAKGPITINAVGKSGGQQFHGEAYIYARTYHLNANDWLNNFAGKNPDTGAAIAPRPQTKYKYPGANFGGPVIFPHSNFNHNHDKLFFFFGFELYRQNVDNGVYHADVPSAHMKAGDFTQADSNHAYTSELTGATVQNTPVNGGEIGTPASNSNANAFTCTQKDSSGNCIGSMVNTGLINPVDAATGAGLVKVYPLPTADPALNQGFNYVSATTRYSNMNQYRARVDYSISNSTKLYVQYNHQKDDAEESLDTLWTGNAQSWDDPTTPYPSPIIESSRSEVVTANMTKVFTPTLTNEVIFNYVWLNLPNHFKDPSKVDRQGLGIDFQTLFPHDNLATYLYPQITGWGDGVSNQINTGFELNGTVFAKKTLPSVADNVSKVWKTHTAKFGFYWERTWNSQPNQGSVDGSAYFQNWEGDSSGNAYADMLLGLPGGYSETNFDPVPVFRYISTEFYAQDSWKVNRKLTVDMGVRVSHLGGWKDLTGYGFAAWYPSLYAEGKGASVAGTTFPGVEWHAQNSSTPLSGTDTQYLFANPRVGAAYDLFGTGNTVLRGGYGIYHYHDEQNVQNGAYGIVRGSFGSPSLSGPFSFVSQNTAALTTPSGINALDPTDHAQPRTQDWSFTVAQRVPWKSLVEISYVGNKSDYLSNYNNSLYQIDDIPIGGLFNAAVCDPTNRTTNPQMIGTSVCGWLPNCDPSDMNDGQTVNGEQLPTDPQNCENSSNNFTNGIGTNNVNGNNGQNQEQAIRPYNHPYSGIKIINHKMYSNYHSLQVTYNKQQGHLIYMINYTFSKALGIRGENGSATGDPTTLKNNYGTLPNNRTNLFNAAYVYQFPNMRQGNLIAKGALNNWQLSGITQYQTGADIQAAMTSNFNYSAYIPAGSSFMGTGPTALPIQASDQNTIGSPDITLMPKVICNPHKGLHANQYINGACFSPFATAGQQGTYIFPTMTGPGFFNSDLSVFKNFVFGSSEQRKLTFRFSGYNFLNHPVRTFENGDPALNMTFNKTGQLQQPATGVNFGYAEYKTGHRIVQGEAKFSF
jgi:hypothetical protein